MVRRCTDRSGTAKLSCFEPKEINFHDLSRCFLVGELLGRGSERFKVPVDAEISPVMICVYSAILLPQRWQRVSLPELWRWGNRERDLLKTAAAIFRC